MAAPSTAHSFLELLRKSNLLPEARLAEYLDKLPGADQMAPVDLAGRMVQDNLLTKFQAGHLLRGRYKNFFFGKFKILEPLGSGGMSQVFLCEHAVMKHRVATKMLPVRDGTDPAAVTRFLREARAAAAVNHPNVVRAHDFDQADGKYYYLVMDYVDGVTLHDLVKAIGPLPPAYAANYVAQAAAGLQHIADCGLVHRDIKPSNLLLDRAGVVKILDLGLARFTGDDQDNVTRQFSGSTVLGTADYLSPEQALMADRIDIRADVYSLGATFYFLLTGRAPFEEATIPQKLLAHQLREPAPPAGAPDDLTVIIRKMMQKNPAFRYQHPGEVIDALVSWLTEELPVPDATWFPRKVGAGGPGSTSSGGPRTAPPSSRTAQRSAVGITGRTPLPKSGDFGRLVDGSGVLAGQSSVLPRLDLPEPPRSRKWLVAGIAAAVLALVGLILAVTKPFKKDPPPGPPGQTTAGTGTPAPAPKPEVPPPAGSLVVSAAGPIKTVAEALKQVKPGGRIVLTDPDHTEQLTVESPPPNVTVQGWPEGQRVRWTAPAGGHQSTPLVRVGPAEGFRLANVVLDGRQERPVLAVLTGKCPGTRLENVTAVGFGSHAIELAGCQGEPGREVRLERVTVTGSGRGTGVRVAGGPPTRHVRINACRFDGPMADAVAVTGPADGVTVSLCRFRETGAGVHVSDTGPVRLAVTNNAFVDVRTAGLATDALPPAGSRFDVTNNLFVRVPKLAACAGVTGQPSFPVPPWVWHDEGFPPEKETNIPPGTRYFRKTFTLPAPPKDARLDIGCVTSFKVWVNGEFVGESNPKHFTRRVYAFPVGKFLKPGANAIAVEATHTRDPIEPGYAVAAGLTARLAEPGSVTPIVAADDTWVSAADAGAGWQAAGFNAAGWAAVKVWNKQGYRFPWEGSIWDAAVAEQLKGSPPFPVAAAGNVRDYNSGEGYPLLDSVRGFVPKLAGDDPADDATYLRTPRSSIRLYSAGVDGKPVGVPFDR